MREMSAYKIKKQKKMRKDFLNFPHYQVKNQLKMNLKQLLVLRNRKPKK